MRRLSTLTSALLALPLLAAAPPAFVEHTIAGDLKGGYQVVAADLNHDGRMDLIALASGQSELVWYENPGWQRHVLAAGQSHMINCAVVGNEIVLASEFANQAKNSIGIVSVLRPNDGLNTDPREPWTVTEIDRLTTSHRLRTADIDGSGHLVVINAALTGAGAAAPDYRDQTPLVYYVPGEWKRRVISTENSGVVHGILIADWDGNGRDAILTASFTGIHVFRYAPARNTVPARWTRTELAKGDPAAWPKSGSSDIAVGYLGVGHPGKTRFLAAIEPWHGNQVAIYTQRGAQWERETIDSSLNDGHTIQAADFNADGNDEIIAGFRGQPRSVYLYTYDQTAKHWTRSDLDKGGMGAAACTVVDLNKDGRPDIACIDSTRLKWYENR